MSEDDWSGFSCKPNFWERCKSVAVLNSRYSLHYVVVLNCIFSINLKLKVIAKSIKVYCTMHIQVSTRKVFTTLCSRFELYFFNKPLTKSNSKMYQSLLHHAHTSFKVEPQDRLNWIFAYAVSFNQERNMVIIKYQMTLHL